MLSCLLWAGLVTASELLHTHAEILPRLTAWLHAFLNQQAVLQAFPPTPVTRLFATRLFATRLFEPASCPAGLPPHPSLTRLFATRLFHLFATRLFEPTSCPAATPPHTSCDTSVTYIIYVYIHTHAGAFERLDQHGDKLARHRRAFHPRRPAPRTRARARGVAVPRAPERTGLLHHIECV